MQLCTKIPAYRTILFLFFLQNLKKMFVKWLILQYNIIIIKIFRLLEWWCMNNLPQINAEQFNQITQENKETCIVVFSKETCSVCNSFLKMDSLNAPGRDCFISPFRKNTDWGTPINCSDLNVAKPSAVFFLTFVSCYHHIASMRWSKQFLTA